MFGEKKHFCYFITGIGIATIGYYTYSKNKNKIDDFLNQKKIKICKKSKNNFNNMTIEELKEKKAIIEELISKNKI